MAKSSSRSRDDDDEDRPPRRARRDRDDDEDDEPPPRRRSRRDEVTLPAGTPTVYVHEQCKGKTEMPAAVIAEYLANPFDLGEDPTTTCSRCDDDVPWQDCYWADTEQNLYEYIDDLRGEMVVSGTDPRPGTPGYNWLLVLFGAVLGGAAGAGVGKAAGNLILLTAVGAVLGAAGGVAWVFIDHAKDVKAFAEFNRKLVKRYTKRHPDARPKSAKRPRRDD